MEAKGNGGTRQMHNYVSLNDSSSIHTPEDEVNYNGNSSKLPENLTVEQLQQQRDTDFKQLGGANNNPNMYAR